MWHSLFAGKVEDVVNEENVVKGEWESWRKEFFIKDCKGLQYWRAKGIYQNEMRVKCLQKKSIAGFCHRLLTETPTTW